MKVLKVSAIALGIGLALASFSSAYGAASRPEQPSCPSDSTNCITYDGTDTKKLKTLAIGVQNSQPEYTNSLGFSNALYSSQEPVSKNTVIVYSGKDIQGVIRGGASNADDVTGNLVYIDLSKATDGQTNLLQSDPNWSYSGEFDSAGGFISAGSTVRGSAQNNKVFLKGTYNPSDDSSKNKGKVSGGGFTGGAVIGSRASKRPEISNNEVWFENVYMVAPTESGVEDATSRNRLLQEVVAARLAFPPGVNSQSDFGANMDNNSLTIKDSNLWVHRLAAAFADTVTNRRDWETVTQTTGYQSNSNALQIENSTISLNNFGSYGNVGVYASTPYYRDSNSNSLVIKNSTIAVKNDNTASVYIHTVGYQGGQASKNILTLDNAVFTYEHGGTAKDKAIDIRNVTNRMSATENQLSITGKSSFDGVKYIMNVYALGDKNYNFSNNTFTVDGQDASQGVTFSSLAGSLYNIYTNNVDMDAMTAKSNSMSIRFAKFQGTRAIRGLYLAQGKSVSEVSGNTLRIENSTFDEGNAIYGIHTKVGGKYQNNTVTIGENVKGTDGSIAKFSTLAGVFLDNLPDSSATTLVNNTLELSSQISVGRLTGFSHMTFNLDGYKDSTHPFITVTEATNPVMVVDAPEAAGRTITNDTTSISIVGTDTSMDSLKDPIVLISSMGGFIDETQVALKEGDYSHLLTQGATLTKVQSLARVESHAIDVSQLKLSIENMPATEANPLLRGRAATQGQNLVLELAGGTDPQPPIPIPPPNQPGVDENGAVTESALSGLNTQFLSDDLLVDSVLLAPTRFNDGLFATARTGRYHVHSRAKQIANTSNALLGYGQSVGQSTVGLFVETGYSSYDTTVATALGDVVGDGSSSYAGAGVFGLYPLGSTGLFLQGYVKAGYLSNNYDVMLSDVPVSLDRTTPYWSAQLGLSWDYQLTDRVQAKTFLNYYYDGQGSETFDLAGTSSVAGAHFELDAMNAHRLVLGQMWTYHYQDDLKPYVGLRIEEALKAKATGQARDGQGYVPLGDTDLEGTTGIVSMGYSYTPTNANYGVHMGANGYVGVRNGVSAQIEAHWRF